jgi:hypothetical protein
LVSRVTRLVAAEIKVTVWPSPLIAGTMLFPFDAVAKVPAGRLARAVRGVQAVVVVARSSQVLRTKMFSTPFWMFDDRFVALVAKAINSPTWHVEVVTVVTPHSLRLGFSLSEFEGVVAFAVVSGVETSFVEGVQLVTTVYTSLHVSRT